jgi:hypothetical protein
MRKVPPPLIRILLSLSTLRLSRLEVSHLSYFIRETSPMELADLLKELEYRIDRSFVNFDEPLRPRERSPQDSGVESLYRRISQLQQADRQLDFDTLAKVISKNLGEVEGRIPRFDRKRGFRAWLGELSKVASASRIYRAALLAKPDRDSEKLPWPLQKK